MIRFSKISLPVLLVDDEPEVLRSHSVMLRSGGIKNVLTLEDSREVLPLLAKQEVALIILDLCMPHLKGNDLLIRLNKDYPQTPVIMVTASDDIEIAVDCMKSGAFDYILKPVEKSHLISSIKKILELHSLRHEVSSLKECLFTDKLQNDSAFTSIITNSKKMHGIFQYIEVVSKSEEPVFITGETGTGKELIAQAIHKLSERPGEFVPVDVAGLDDTVFSDTLFGHKKGAYTNADQPREGLASKAKKGTLFLDEIGDLKEPSQVKLLRLLQEKMYYSLGSDSLKAFEGRIIAATNKNVQKMMSEEKFRRDLYYRLQTHHIKIPPLRERKEDIPLLVAHFIDEAAKALGKKEATIPSQLITLLNTYNFPGNIRELRAMIFDAMAQHKSGILSMNSFKEIIGHENVSSNNDSPALSKNVNLVINASDEFPTLKEGEKFLISEALKCSDGNQGIAASLLGITRQALNQRLKKKEKTPEITPV